MRTGCRGTALVSHDLLDSFGAEVFSKHSAYSAFVEEAPERFDTRHDRPGPRQRAALQIERVPLAYTIVINAPGDLLDTRGSPSTRRISVQMKP